MIVPSVYYDVPDVKCTYIADQIILVPDNLLYLGRAVMYKTLSPTG